MSIVSTTIPNLVNGVSQQPYALRLASQAEEQINGYSSVVEGLRKRPPSRHSSRFLSVPTTNAYIHTINRDASERYVLVATNGSVRVFGLDGLEKTVTYPNGTGYLASSNPQNDFAAVTVADYTFFLNKAQVVQANAADPVPSRPFEAMFWVRQGAYSATYVITVAGTQVSFQTPDASNAAHATQIATDYIAVQLYNQLAAAGVNAGNGWTLGVAGSVIYVAHATNFYAYAQDSVGDTVLKLIKGSVQRFSDLPAKAWAGFRVRVAGTAEASTDDYYVEYDTSEASAYGGVWKECPKGGELRSYLASTMPHTLVREANGTFSFKQATWPARTVGDLDGVPMPSFVGKRINDVFFHRNRLGFLADENVVFSRAGEFFKFFPSSAIQVLDTDPVDVAVSHVKVSNLRHAIPFNETLLLFSDQTQFTLGKAELLTPRTVSINQTTEFECSLRAKPVGAGRNVYFSVNRGQYTGIREYYVDGETETNDAAEVTAHCPRYVPKGVVKLAASSNEDVLVALAESKRNSLYVYRYYWSGQEKLQSSWSRWDFGTNDSILSMDFIESDLWMVVSRPDGTYVEVISLEPGRFDVAANFSVHLDRRLDETRMTTTYDAARDVTLIQAPWNFYGETYQIVAWHGDATYKAGRQVPIEWENPTTMRVVGRLTKFFFGRQYALRYKLSTLVIREDSQGGGGQQPIGVGRLQLRKMTMTYNNAGYFRVEVTPSQRNTYTYVFSGRVVGSGQNRLGGIAIEEGTFSFPIQAKNDQVDIEVVNDSFLPSAFLSAEWEAFFSIRSRRL